MLIGQENLREMHTFRENEEGLESRGIFSESDRVLKEAVLTN